MKLKDWFWTIAGFDDEIRTVYLDAKSDVFFSVLKEEVFVFRLENVWDGYGGFIVNRYGHDAVPELDEGEIGVSLFDGVWYSSVGYQMFGEFSIELKAYRRSDRWGERIDMVRFKMIFDGALSVTVHPQA